MSRLERFRWSWRGLPRAALVSLLLLAAMFAWGFLLEPQRLVVTRTELTLPDWPKPLAGLRVALLSDLHIGSPFWDLEALSRLVERTNAETPDLVLLAGDYLINDVPGGVFVPPEPIAERLAKLKAPLGVFAVLGNHDWWNDGERTRKAFDENGIVVLEEDSRRLELHQTPLYVVGLADQLTRSSAPQAVLAAVPAHSPTLLLVHEPDVFASSRAWVSRPASRWRGTRTAAKSGYRCSDAGSCLRASANATPTATSSKTGATSSSRAAWARA